MGYNLVRNVPRRDALDDSVFCDASMCTMNPSLSVCVCGCSIRIQIMPQNARMPQIRSTRLYAIFFTCYII